MKTRHVLAIGILTAIAVGLLAIGIKTTEQKPKVQTKAYDYISNVTKDNNTTTITIKGTETQYTNDSISFTYTISQTENGYNIKASYGATKIAGIRITKPETEKINTSITTNNTELDRIIVYRTSYTITQISSSFAINCNYTTTILWDGGDEQQDYTWSMSGIFITGAPSQNTNTQVSILLGIGTTYTNINNYGTNQYQTGYTTGYQTKGDLADGNFVSIQETMLNVLTMPFTFISQGFNVTLWEGTPYAINIGNFIKSLIAIATILFIIKMFTSGFSVIGNYTTGTGNNISQWRKNRSERKLNESKARLNDRTNPNHKTRDSHVTIKKE